MRNEGYRTVRAAGRLAAVLAACAGAGAVAPAARANVTNASWIDVNNYHFRVIHMPDLDQRRVPGDSVLGLPGNGSMYCVPTATMNLFIYAANHGFPDMLPGPGNYQTGLYNAASLNIGVLGVGMSTDAVNGTGSQGWYDGAVNWLSLSDIHDKFTILQYTANGSYAPRTKDMALTAVGGAIVAFAYGRYSNIGSYQSFTRVNRTGGHVVTLTRAFAESGEQPIIHLRDPADDPANTTQSTFVDRVTEVTNRTFAMGAGANPTLRTMAWLTDLGGGETTFRCIDEYVALKPKAGYAFSNPTMTITLYRPFSLLGGPVAVPAQIVLPGDGSVHDAISDPDQTGFALIRRLPSGATELLHVVEADGSVVPIASVPGAHALLFSRHRDLYVSTNGNIFAFDVNLLPAVQKYVAFPPDPIHALAADESDDHIFGVSISDRMIFEYRKELGEAIGSWPIPTQVPMAGDGSVVINPLDGKLWMVSSAANAAYGLTLAGGVPPQVETLLLPAGPEAPPTSISADDRGHLFIVKGGQVLEFMKTAAGGWVQVQDSEWSKFAVGPKFRVTRSQSNHDPSMTGPAWNNIDPGSLTFAPPVPNCDADLNGDGLINSTDLNIVLSAFGCEGQGCIGDVDGDDATNSTDLNLVLTQFGEACP